MEVLYQLARSLMLLIIFAGFCELLLPQGGFRRYVRMVVGLLVIAMLLQPVVQFINDSWNLEAALELAWFQAFDHGGASGDWSQRQTTALVAARLQDQVRDFLHQYYPQAEFEVELAVEFDEYGNLAEFQGMKVYVQPPTTTVQPVARIVIGGEGDGGQNEPGLARKLAAHLGLPADKVTVWAYTSGGEGDGR